MAGTERASSEICVKTKHECLCAVQPVLCVAFIEAKGEAYGR